LKKAAAPERYEQLDIMAENFADGLRTLARQRSFEMSVVQNSSLLWLFPGREKDVPSTPERFPKDLDKRFKPFFLALLEQGIYLAPSGYEVMFLSHAHTKDILERSLEKFDRAFRSLAG